jgi:hypothetical protein
VNEYPNASVYVSIASAESEGMSRSVASRMQSCRVAMTIGRPKSKTDAGKPQAEAHPAQPNPESSERSAVVVMAGLRKKTRNAFVFGVKAD